MPLSHPLFSANARIRRASENMPPMRRGERDADAVRLLQHALIAVKAATMRRSIVADGLDGDYGSETVEGVRNFQKKHGLVGPSGRGDGVAGHDTWAALDAEAPTDLGPINLTPSSGVTPPAESPTTTPGPNHPVLPSAAVLDREYRRFRDIPRPGKPCDRDITHQCAVRMSVALMRADIGFHFNNPNLEWTHSGGGTCGVPVPHNAGAQRLFDHLRLFYHFERYRNRGRDAMDWREIAARCDSRPGLVFFQDLAGKRRNGRGDHIDFWDGHATMNDRLAYNEPDERAHEDITDRLHFFRKATVTYFCPIPA